MSKLLEGPTETLAPVSRTTETEAVGGYASSVFARITTPGSSTPGDLGHVWNQVVLLQGTWGTSWRQEVLTLATWGESRDKFAGRILN